MPNPNAPPVPLFTGTSNNALPPLPKFDTRKALIIINMQNDTFDLKGGLVLCEDQEFKERTKVMVPYYRRVGDVVWARTEIDEAGASKPTAQQAESSSLVQDDAVNGLTTANLSLEDALGGDGNTPQIDAQTIGEYFPTSRSKAAMRKASAKARADARSGELDAFEYEDADNYLKKPRKGQSATYYRTGSYGAAFCSDIAALIDDKRDIVIAKNHYSAFDATPLLMSLRMKLVTHIDIAGSLSNVSVYTTAADAVRHGFSVSVVEDCLGYRSESKHLDAMRKMADMLGVSGVDSEEIIEEAGGQPPPALSAPPSESPGFQGTTPPSTLSSTPSSRQDESPNAPPRYTISPTIKLDGADADGQRLGFSMEQRSSQERSQSPQPVLLGAETANQSRKKDKPKLLGPGDHMGEGDSTVIVNALSFELSETAFEALRGEIDWQTMHHRSGEVPRKVAVQGEIGHNNSVPIYRHPADESPPLLPFSRTVLKIRDELQIRLKQPFNHVLVQLYRNGHDNISEHSDKVWTTRRRIFDGPSKLKGHQTLDIVRGSSVINLSLGAERTMTLRAKKSSPYKQENGYVPARTMQKIPMPHNSVFVLGWRTNSKWLHGIRPDKRPPCERSEVEKAFRGERISLTFRHIGTFTNRERTRIWGQGARSKFQQTAGLVSSSNGTEMEAMIVAFGKENQLVDFDWDAEYGAGFDVTNLSVPRSPINTMLYLCGDEMSNLRVKIAIMSRNIPCQMAREKPRDPLGRPSPAIRRTIFSLSGDENPLFRDIDTGQSEISGDLAILFYIGKFYPVESSASISPRELHRIDSTLFARITQANELLFLWQEMRGVPLSSSTRATHQVRRIASPMLPTLPGISSVTSSPMPLAFAQLHAMASPHGSGGGGGISSTTHSAASSPRPLPPLMTTSTLPQSPESLTGANAAAVFEAELELWEGYAEAERGFISGDLFTIVDCAFWPVLNEVVRKWQGWRESRYPQLADYWRKVGAMPTTRQALVEKGEALPIRMEPEAEPEAG